MAHRSCTIWHPSSASTDKNAICDFRLTSNVRNAITGFQRCTIGVSQSGFYLSNTLLRATRPKSEEMLTERVGAAAAARQQHYQKDA